MNIAVTGGSGQLGTHILRRLLRDRAVRGVVSIDRRPPSVPGGKLRAVTCDVRDPAIVEHLRGADALIHLAFVVTQHLPRAEFDAINIGGSQNVFTAAAKAGVRHVTYASSVAAYGVLPGHPAPLTEDAPRKQQPGFPYANAKFEVEAFLDTFAAEHPDIAVARMRPTILVGEGMEHPLGAMLRRGVLPYIPGGSDAPLPIVWDEDVADAFVLAVKARASGAFNLSADELLPIPALAREAGLRLLTLPRSLARLSSRASAALARFGVGQAHDPAWLEDHGAVLLPTSARARAELGWRPRCPTAAEVLRQYLRTVPGRIDPRIRAFFAAIDFFSARMPPERELGGFRSRVHLRLTGRRGGDFSLVVNEGRLQVRPGLPRPPTATITLAAPLLIDLIAGRTDFGSAQLTGKIRVEGEGHAAMLLSGMIAIFRSQTDAAPPGPGRLLARGLLRWVSSGPGQAPLPGGPGDTGAGAGTSPGGAQ
jgi:nucleoside-diphosphate-sugar epimerase/putative sterol carrier protein